MAKSNLVVKSNRLNTAIQNLSLTEVRLIQIAIVDARETGTGLSAEKPLIISAMRYAEAFDVSRQTAFEAILHAEKNLFERRFSFLDDDARVVKSRWVQRVKYLDDLASIEVVLTYDVVNEITRIDGYETFFTKYLLEQTASLNSAYSVRLYELMAQWKAAVKTPVFDLLQFRHQMGVEDSEYKLMSDFKKRVLQTAIDEINEKTDIKIAYKQLKTGRKITGLSFTVRTKAPAIEHIADTDANAFIKLTDSQINLFSSRLAALPELGSTAPIGKSTADFAAIIANHLADENLQKQYLPYLAKVGYQSTKRKK